MKCGFKVAAVSIISLAMCIGVNATIDPDGSHHFSHQMPIVEPEEGSLLLYENARNKNRLGAMIYAMRTLR